MDYKQSSILLKDYDEKKGVVKAYANAYNNEDSDTDISAPGSFNKTIQENGKRVRVLKDHNHTISLGVPLEMHPNDPYGLLTVTKFNLNKEVARDMFTDILLAQENDLPSELSIGYKTMRRDEHDKRIIKEYKLFEYSFLSSWAANQLAVVQDVKGMSNIKSLYGIMSLIEKSYDMNYSDPRLREIENMLKALSNVAPSQSDTQNIEPHLSALKQFNKDNF